MQSKQLFGLPGVISARSWMGGGCVCVFFVGFALGGAQSRQTHWAPRNIWSIARCQTNGPERLAAVPNSRRSCSLWWSCRLARHWRRVKLCACFQFGGSNFGRRRRQSFLTTERHAERYIRVRFCQLSGPARAPEPTHQNNSPREAPGLVGPPANPPGRVWLASWAPALEWAFPCPRGAPAVGEPGGELVRPAGRLELSGARTIRPHERAKIIIFGQPNGWR